MSIDQHVARDRLIAHAGGEVEGIRYTNSLDALLNSSNYFDLIEVDVVLGRDGPLIAHDGLEKNYLLDRKFSSVTTSEFSSAKYLNRFKTTSLCELCTSQAFSDVRFVLDIKGDTEEYRQTLDAVIASIAGLQWEDRIILQFYCIEDLRYAMNLGCKYFIATLWKNFHEPFGPLAKKFITDAFSEAQEKIVGISLHMKHLKRVEFDLNHTGIAFLLGYDRTIYLHGHDEQSDSLRAVRKGFGLYSHKPVQLSSGGLPSCLI